MAREHIERELRCQNSWRPSDGPLRHQSPQRSSVQWKPIAPSHTTMRSLQPSTSHSVQYGSRLTPATHGTLKTPSQAFKNPNLIPVLSRHTRNTAVVTPDINLQQDAEPEERLPQIWHPSIDDLVRRTAHDYDLVMNYERDAEGGQRWLPEDIATIRDVGKRLHSDIFALRRSQRAVAYQGDQDKKMMQQIKRDANFLKLLCERVQRAINKYEQKCEFELLRDGVYAQDEDGSFYKPTTPQQHVAEGEFLWDDVQPSIKGTEDDHLNIHNRHDRLVHKDRHDEIASTWKFQTPPEETQETHRRLPNRSLAVDFLFQQPSFDTVKLEAARQSPPRRSDRVFDSRTSNAHQDVPPAHRRHNSAPDLNTLPDQPRSHNKTRDRARNNRQERNGLSRRQAKREQSQAAGHLGKHLLHY